MSVAQEAERRKLRSSVFRNHIASNAPAKNDGAKTTEAAQRRVGGCSEATDTTIGEASRQVSVECDTRAETNDNELNQDLEPTKGENVEESSSQGFKDVRWSEWTVITYVDAQTNKYGSLKPVRAGKGACIDMSV